MSEVDALRDAVEQRRTARIPAPRVSPTGLAKRLHDGWTPDDPLPAHGLAPGRPASRRGNGPPAASGDPAARAGAVGRSVRCPGTLVPRLGRSCPARHRRDDPVDATNEPSAPPTLLSTRSLHRPSSSPRPCPACTPRSWSELSTGCRRQEARPRWWQPPGGQGRGVRRHRGRVGCDRGRAPGDRHGRGPHRRRRGESGCSRRRPTTATSATTPCVTGSTESTDSDSALNPSRTAPSTLGLCDGPWPCPSLNARTV